MERLTQYDVFLIPCEEIYYDDEFNCRGPFTLQSVIDLASSIADEGLKFPIVVQPAADTDRVPDGYKYALVAGHRRYRAVTAHLKWGTIPGRIVSGLTHAQAASFNLLENLEREDLNHLEQARALEKMFPYASDRECAAAVHRSTRWVTQRRLLLRQPVEVQELVGAGRLTLNQIQEIINKIKSPAAKIRTARRLSEHSERSRVISRELRMQLRPKTRKEINDKIGDMLEMGLYDVEPIITRFAAWVSRGIDDETFDKDLQDYVNQKSK